MAMMHGFANALKDSGNRHWLNWAALMVLMMVWGSSFILIKKGLLWFGVMELGAMRIAMSCLVLMPFALKRISRIPSRYLWYFALSGIIGNGIPPFLFAKAQTVIDSFLAGVLNSLTPLFTLIAGLIFFKVKTRWWNVLGVCLGLAGAIGLLLAVHDPDLGNGAWYGLLVIAATIGYAFNMNIIKHYLSRFDALTITSVVFLMIGIPAIVYLFGATSFVEVMKQQPGAWEGLGYVAVLAIVGTAASMVVHNWLIKRTSALFASTVTYMMPLVSILWGIADGEAFLLFYLLWILLILTGVYLANSQYGLKPKG